jgi:general secretion pathway protein H
LKVIVEEIATALRRTRAAAMRMNDDEVFTLDLGRRTYATGDDPSTLIPDIFELSLYTARNELVDDKVGQIRFFADGSATGGRIGLAHKEGRHDIHINWLTGRVWVHRP